MSARRSWLLLSTHALVDSAAMTVIVYNEPSRSCTSIYLSYINGDGQSIQSSGLSHQITRILLFMVNMHNILALTRISG
ncbi:hypothetical protein EV421DRAFT_1800209, partial [Armillaria borealis]